MNNDDVLRLSGHMISIPISPKVREHLIAVNEASKEEAERDAARAAAVEPPSVWDITQYLLHWGDLRAVHHTSTDDTYHHYTAKTYPEMDPIEVRVNCTGYIVDDTYYLDVWERPAGSDDETTWQNFDSVPKELK